MIKHLTNNVYPGRGIVVGKDKNNQLIILYWIMGRSSNSRNRIFVYNNNILNTQPKDESLVEDSSLIVYNAMRDIGGNIIITNGAQTYTIYEQLCNGRNFIEALSGHMFEPDAPNYTPRISALVDQKNHFQISVISRNHTGNADHKFYSYDNIRPGTGYCVTTYMEDGEPLPSFNIDPVEVTLRGNIALAYWKELNPVNRISLMARVGNKMKIINGAK